MPRFLILPSFMLAAVVVAGCSSGSSPAAGPTSPTTLERLNIGTTGEDGATGPDGNLIGANGQPFADQIEGTNGRPLPGAGFDDEGEVLLVSRSTNGDTDEIVINLSSAAYSIDRGENPNGGADGSFLIDVNGETLEFFADPETFFPLTATGSDHTFYEISRPTVGLFSSTNLISISSVDGLEPLALYTFGFETNPNLLRSEGTAIYSGALAGYVVTDGELDEVSGSVTFTARFDDSRISGSASATADLQTFNFDIAETGIIGNGFSSTATLTNCPDEVVCTSATQIGGAFFGPDGSEISGIALIDETFETPIGSFNTIGAAGYTADRIDD